MTFDAISSLNDNFSNFPGIESNYEDSSNLSQINNIFDFRPPLLSLNEDEDESEKLLYISKQNSERNNNSRHHIFTTETVKKKRGIKRNKESKKAEHSIYSNDNITSKIQIHFLNFIVSFLNDCLLSFGTKELSFKNIDYKVKSKVSRKHLEEMKNSSILDILKNIDISNKYKHCDKDTNKMNVEDLIKYSWFQKIFNMKYLEIFLYYYNDMKPLNELTLFGNRVILSEKTKSFYYLLKKNEETKEQIIYFCKLIYLTTIKDI